MSQDKRTAEDPKGLIFESYRLSDVGDAECRTIFMDWALSLPEDLDQQQAIRTLLERHGDDENHPMSIVLRAGLEKIIAPRRRGGAKARRSP